MSLGLSKVFQSETESSTASYSVDCLCEAANQMSAGSQSGVNSVDRYNMMKALAEGALLLRAGRLIKLEDRTSQKKLMA